MRDPASGAPPWTASPTGKEKHAAQRAVTALLDILAPEPAVRRAERPRLRVEQHRTPDGCVLQARDAALSVSWFSEPSEGAPLGELHVVLWQGTVARRGSARTGRGAVVTGELVVRPVDQGDGEWGWRATDGTRYTTDALAAHCLALLEDQIGKAALPGAAPPERQS